MHVVGLYVTPASYAGREMLKDVDDFLSIGQGPAGMSKLQRKRITQKASKFTLIGEDLMVYGHDVVLRRVLYKEEIGMVLTQCHEESGHQGKDYVLFLILRAGFWWPSLVRDVHYWCKTCHKCQVMGERRLVAESQGAILAQNAFEKLGLDAIGPLPKSASGKKYILVAIDYLTRWVEAKAVKEANSFSVAQFVFDSVCCRFGVPWVLISDRGQGFHNKLVRALVENMEIQQRFSSPYHPQCNGLVENANGQIIKILTKYIDKQMEDWEGNLDKCLWASRTSYKVATTNFTPYELVFGKEAVYLYTSS
ncbi:hypothetical protein GOP47_0024205 [Adiantum capillus-veneris]|uniref:Integrase catalytic domain-containing protein n=1 Tax=Adiantum capillus-veneris TaxID=13818 RepID=A0A9D4U5G6_ADICA|nr:hypothetical protein GOP47_0024205 [Adiantum capillus-veneris]